MNGFTQSFTSNGANVTDPHQHRNSTDLSSCLPNGSRMHADGNGAMPMPVAVAQRPFSGAPGEMGPTFPTMGMPRSPPKNKSESTNNNFQREYCWLRYNADTAHVPCRFFLVGQCQAGRMCPFSHDLESVTRPQICKYFSKGTIAMHRKHFCGRLLLTFPFT